mmetsp:Transcript_118377/g.377335  ORF Transcript_118377/g.377335 Transcript_118377/m.377335 type:complete len:96 (-) Transcript_118377:729-1016(-)
MPSYVAFANGASGITPMGAPELVVAVGQIYVDVEVRSAVVEVEVAEIEVAATTSMVEVPAVLVCELVVRVLVVWVLVVRVEVDEVFVLVFTARSV